MTVPSAFDGVLRVGRRNATPRAARQAVGDRERCWPRRSRLAGEHELVVAGRVWTTEALTPMLGVLLMASARPSQRDVARHGDGDAADGQRAGRGDDGRVVIGVAVLDERRHLGPGQLVDDDVVGAGDGVVPPTWTVAAVGSETVAAAAVEARWRSASASTALSSAGRACEASVAKNALLVVESGLLRRRAG